MPATDSTSHPSDRAEEELRDQMEGGVPGRGIQRLPMVGLGGSAGSIAALQDFFRAMPVDSGMAFVVILHLSPEHESTMAELLGRATTMHVVQARDGVKVEANSVYVIPPGKNLAAVDGHLQLTELDHSRGKRVTVDLFFRSLADSHGAHSAAIVLSGADGDGALGIKRIKECGGLTIAQDPDEAEHSSMPRSAIDTGMVDWVLQVAQMPARLLDYQRNEQRLKLPPEEGPQPAQAPAATPSESEGAMREVLGFLRTRTGRDFAYYKRATILRRIARRMQVNGVEDMPAYLLYLRTHPGEAGALLQDLLISVTNFFRDRESFAELEARIPGLFAGKGQGDAVRVWVPACATGEEAYSIAMLLIEHARTLEAPPSIQVFATDLDNEVIQVAREGVYLHTMSADMSEERLRRFFVKEDRVYRVRREVREVVLFAVHDLLKDSPFSRLDFISCRNLLIYLNHDAQARAFEIFHFALRPDGLLFLGTSESIADGTPLFSTLDKKHRLYARRTAVRLGLPVATEPGTLARAMKAQARASSGPVVPGPAFAASASLPLAILHGVASTNERGSSLAELHFKLIERFAPPSLIVNADHEIVHLSENAGRYLQLTGGEPTMNLLRVVHPMLRVELRGALFRASQTGAPVEVFRVPLEIDGVRSAVDLRVAPARELAPDFLLVVFEPREPAGDGEAPRVEPAEPASKQMERELEQIKTHLRGTVEQYEVSTEELKASNEELQAMNEELRSATEELETSREELQSINEELTTVNSELKNKVEELGRLNSDLHNLMASTAIATVFLDRDLQIMRYTPAAVTIFHLIPSDLGRPLADLGDQLDYPALLEDAAAVLARLVPVEREVSERRAPSDGGAPGRSFLARLLPYRTLEDRIAGVVLNFVDITERKRAEEALAASEEQFRRAIEDAPIPIIMQAEDGEVLQLSRTWSELTGYTLADLPTLDAWLQRAYGPGAGEVRTHMQALFAGERRTVDVEFAIRTRDETARHWSFSASSPGMLRDGRRFIIGMAVDITARKEAQKSIRESAERFRLMAESMPQKIFTATATGDVDYFNQRWLEFTGKTFEEIGAWGWKQIVHPDDLEETVRRWQHSLDTGEPSDMENRFLRHDGEWRWNLSRVQAVRDAEGRVLLWIGSNTDIHEVRHALEEVERASRAKDDFLAALSHELRTPLTPVLMMAAALETDPALSLDVRDQLGMMRRNIELEARLIDDLLDLTRISRGKLEIQPVVADIHRLIEHTAEIVRSEGLGKQVRVRFTLEAARHHTMGDPARLQQVFWNIIKNAIKFTATGGDVTVSSRNDDAGKIIVSVADTGVGIGAEDLSRIFNAFEQIEVAGQHRFGGLGLGLAISKAIVEMHGGAIDAASEGEGRGATFTVALATVDAPEVMDRTRVPLPAPDRALRLLVVEDHEATLTVLTRLLTRSGHRVTPASSIQQALAAAAADTFDVVISDLGLPDGNGLDLMREIKRTHGWPGIALSGFGMEDDLRQTKEAGFFAHLVKPVNLDQLRQLLGEVSVETCAPLNSI